MALISLLYARDHYGTKQQNYMPGHGAGADGHVP